MSFKGPFGKYLSLIYSEGPEFDSIGDINQFWIFFSDVVHSGCVPEAFVVRFNLAIQVPVESNIIHETVLL